MKVSIIVPSYNHAAYLPLRLQTILNQTYQHFELIILNDASPDNSRAVIKAYRYRADRKPFLKRAATEKAIDTTVV